MLLIATRACTRKWLELCHREVVTTANNRNCCTQLTGYSWAIWHPYHTSFIHVVLAHLSCGFLCCAWIIVFWWMWIGSMLSRNKLPPFSTILFMTWCMDKSVWTVVFSGVTVLKYFALFGSFCYLNALAILLTLLFNTSAIRVSKELDVFFMAYLNLSIFKTNITVLGKWCHL